MALHEYLATGVGEDWADGIITRREALRRLALLGLSATAAVAPLEACAPAAGSASPGLTTVPTGTAAPPATGTTGDSPAPSGEPGASLAATGNETNGEAITFPGPKVELQGFYAPAANPHGAMLVVHENRGLNDHIRSVASRLAADSYSALAIDLLPRKVAVSLSRRATKRRRRPSRRRRCLAWSAPHPLLTQPPRVMECQFTLRCPPLQKLLAIARSQTWT